MLNGFTFGGVHSSIYGAYMVSVDRSLLPQMKIRERVLANKHGTYNFNENTYEKRKISISITFFEDTMIDNKLQAREIAKWLSTQNEPKQLIFDDEPDKYYMAKIYTPLNFITELSIGNTEIEFDCQPFAYSVYDTGIDSNWDSSDFPWITDMRWGGSDNYTFTSTGLTTFLFDNFATQTIDFKCPQTSKFNIIIDGIWDNLQIQLNGKTLQYTDADSGVLIFDNVNLEVTLDGNNALSNVNGDLGTFLEVISGTNEIIIDGTNINVNVTIDFRPMWR